jgi:hypothetical protein
MRGTERPVPPRRALRSFTPDGGCTEDLL